MRRKFEENKAQKLQRFEKAADSAKRFATCVENEDCKGLELRPDLWCILGKEQFREEKLCKARVRCSLLLICFIGHTQNDGFKT